jgi:hypothetical protein
LRDDLQLEGLIAHPEAEMQADDPQRMVRTHIGDKAPTAA